MDSLDEIGFENAFTSFSGYPLFGSVDKLVFCKLMLYHRDHGVCLLLNPVVLHCLIRFYEKNRFLPMRKQRHRSAVQPLFSLHG